MLCLLFTTDPQIALEHERVLEGYAVLSVKAFVRL